RHDFLGEHKVLNYLSSVLGKVMAARHRAFEGLFVDAAGCVTEGTTSNIFVSQQGQLCTPPIAGILPGVTRRFVIEAVTASGTRVVQRALKTEDLIAADEAFLTSSLAEVVPIVAVNARRIADGKVGPLTRRVQGHYRQMVDQAVAGI